MALEKEWSLQMVEEFCQAEGQREEKDYRFLTNLDISVNR